MPAVVDALDDIGTADLVVHLLQVRPEDLVPMSFRVRDSVQDVLQGRVKFTPWTLSTDDLEEDDGEGVDVALLCATCGRMFHPHEFR